MYRSRRLLTLLLACVCLLGITRCATMGKNEDPNARTTLYPAYMIRVMAMTDCGKSIGVPWRGMRVFIRTDANITPLLKVILPVLTKALEARGATIVTDRESAQHALDIFEQLPDPRKFSMALSLTKGPRPANISVPAEGREATGTVSFLTYKPVCDLSEVEWKILADLIGQEAPVSICQGN